MNYRFVFLALIVAEIATADDTSKVVLPESESANLQIADALSAETHLSAIKQLIEDREYRDAVRKLKPLAKSNADNPEIWRLLGLAAHRKGDFLGSKVAFEKSLKLDAENSETLSMQAELFISIGDKQSARSNLDKLELLCPLGCEARDQVATALELL